MGTQRSHPARRILLNLVSNAVSYTARGKVVVGCRLRGRHLRIDVLDSGPGIPEDEHISIFREFYQLGGPQRERQGGMGLGLAIVDRLCRLLKHEIDFASALGKGSRFSVLVPSVAARALTVEPEVSVHTTPDSIGGKLVVVIDDDPLVLDSTGGLLRSWGCHVLTAGSARVALADLAECNQSPDLIISDYRPSDGRLESKRSKSCANSSTSQFRPFSSAATRLPHGCTRCARAATICCTSRCAREHCVRC